MPGQFGFALGVNKLTARAEQKPFEQSNLNPNSPSTSGLVRLSGIESQYGFDPDRDLIDPELSPNPF